MSVAGDGFETQLNPLATSLAPFVRFYLQNWQPYRPHWTYEDGCVWLGALALFEATGARFLHDFVYHEVMRRIAVDGAIEGFRAGEYNIDNLKPGSVLLKLHTTHPHHSQLRAAISVQAQQLREHPRTQSGNYWHKQIYPNQVWLDGLYMAQPFQCGMAMLEDRPDWIVDTQRQFEQVRAVLRDPATGLYWHGWDESRSERWSNPVTGRSPNFWGRAMGWYVMALVDCIEIAGTSSPSLAASLGSQLRECCEALLRVRSPAGLWWQVLDLPEAPGNYEETSASLMIAYALMKAARLGVLKDEAATAGARAHAEILRRFLTATELAGICGVAGLGNTPYRDGSVEYYLSEKIVANDPKGVAALLLASAERLQFEQQKPAH